MNRIQRILIAVCSLTLSATAWSATTSSADASYLKRATPRFETWAGSSDNLSSLASGLRSGTEITLTGDGQKVVFTSPTKPMGYGNITRALDLAQRQLALQGITDPTPSQLQTALMGGTITTSKGTVTYTGILQMRSDGMGWGQIAHSVGVQPGLGKGPTTASTSSTSVTSASGHSTTASGASNRPETAGATGKGQSGIATAAGGSSNSAAAAHASARGLGNSAAVTSAAGTNAGGAASAAGGGNGNAFGRGGK